MLSSVFSIEVIICYSQWHSFMMTVLKTSSDNFNIWFICVGIYWLFFPSQVGTFMFLCKINDIFIISWTYEILYYETLDYSIFFLSRQSPIDVQHKGWVDMYVVSHWIPLTSLWQKWGTDSHCLMIDGCSTSSVSSLNSNDPFLAKIGHWDFEVVVLL